MDEIIYHENPELHQPLLILGFEGWPNAAEVSSLAIQHLIDLVKARRFASVPFERFYDMTSSRPVAIIKEGRVLEVKFPAHHFYYSKLPSSQDLILFHGIEPHLRWNAFAQLMMDLAENFQVTQIITLGGTYDYVPHTRPPVVSALSNDKILRERIIEMGLGLTEYVGPISIHTFIHQAALKRGLKVISLWGHSPQYLQAKNVKVAYWVLKYLVQLTGLTIDLRELAEMSDLFDQQVNQLVDQDPKLKEVISKLDEIYEQSGRSAEAHLKEEGIKKEEKVIYMQAILKKQEDEEKKES